MRCVPSYRMHVRSRDSPCHLRRSQRRGRQSLQVSSLTQDETGVQCRDELQYLHGFESHECQNFAPVSKEKPSTPCLTCQAEFKAPKAWRKVDTTSMLRGRTALGFQCGSNVMRMFSSRAQAAAARDIRFIGVFKVRRKVILLLEGSQRPTLAFPPRSLFRVVWLTSHPIIMLAEAA